MDIKKAQELVKKSPTLETFDTIQKAAESATKSKDAALARKYSDLLEAVFVQLTKGSSDRAFEEFDFAENQLAKLDVQGRQDLIDLIDEVYQDGVEKLIAVSLDDQGDIRVVFEDVNGRTIRRFVGKIADPDSNPVISYKLADESSASFSEYDFAAKAKAGVKKKNCTAGKSIACGASCISAKKTCRSEAPVSDKAKGKAKSVKAKLSGDAPSNPAVADRTQDEYRENLRPEFRDFYDLASGKIRPNDVQISDEALASAKEFMDTGENVDSKMSAIRRASRDITEDEARSLATWISVADDEGDMKYAAMNRRLYSPDSFEENERAVLATNVLAARALQKLPPITPERMEQESELYNRDVPLQRHMNLDPDRLEEFASRYEAAIGGDGTLRESTFFATTHLESLGWIDTDANVTYRIKPRLDGQGQARHIDHFKNSAIEGEIMYPPQSQFRVTAVRRPNPYQMPADQRQAVTIANRVEYTKEMAGRGWQSRYRSMFGEAPPKAAEITRLQGIARQAREAEREYNRNNPDASRLIIEMEEP